jgi:hypothetical protein
MYILLNRPILGTVPIECILKRKNCDKNDLYMKIDDLKICIKASKKACLYGADQIIIMLETSAIWLGRGLFGAAKAFPRSEQRPILCLKGQSREILKVFLPLYTRSVVGLNMNCL